MNYIWLWIALDKLTYSVVGFQLGNRGFDGMGKFYHNKLAHLEVDTYYSDDWQAYSLIEKHGGKLVRGKSYTTHIESFNSLVRHYLARFHRKTKCYSKSEEYINYSLSLLFNKLNNTVGWRWFFYQSPLELLKTRDI